MPFMLNMVWATAGGNSPKHSDLPMRISLRLKLALISLLLLAIPYTGMRLASIVKTNLISSRKEALLFSARAVASAISSREGLFDSERFLSLNQNRDLYLYRLTNPMRLNGKIDDWQKHMENAAFFGKDHLLAEDGVFLKEGSGFTHLLGQRGKYLYSLFLVTDDRLVFREKDSLSLTRSDHLIITIERQDNQRETYIITPKKPGWVNGFLMSKSRDRLIPQRSETRIQGIWKPTEKGYVIELRIPLELLGNKLAFAIGDVDDPVSRNIHCLIGTANTEQPENIGWLLSQSSVIEDILTSLNRPQSRIQIVDSSRHIRASYGSLKISDTEGTASEKNFSLYRFLSPLFNLFTEPLFNDFPDITPQPSTLELPGINDALAGKNSISTYRLENTNVEIMTAITPLYEKEDIIGAVVVEQTTNSILALKNKVIEESFAFALTVLLFGGLGLLFFAYRISSRITKLRDAAAHSVGDTGQILSIPAAATTQDEIGDLSRALNTILTRLKAQEQYREKMADNLEHEMRTPLASASASLKNLASEIQSGPTHITDYVKWAIRDIKRMEDLLTAIRDATSLTHALDHRFHDRFDLSQALRMWLEHGWKQTFNEVNFLADFPEQETYVEGDPDRILQALDKLIENGVAFHTPGTPIQLTMSTVKNQVVITVFNQGNHIPGHLLEEIFNSMVSERTKQDQRPHLGLGLFIVRTIVEHHGGSVKATNIHDEPEGVCFTINLPGKHL